MRVLVVDDESVICEVFGYAFEKVNATTVAAESGEAALRELGTQTFDAAVIDKNLPGISGLELVRRIRASDPRIAILMMTSYSSTESAEEALNLDVDAYAEKPFPQISAVVERVLFIVEARKARLDRGSVPAGRPRVVLIALAPVRDTLVDAAGPIADVATAGVDEESVLAALDPVPDLVVIQSSLFGDLTVPLVERIRRRAPDAEVIVLSSLQLGLRALQRLIELGVRRLVSDEPGDSHVAMVQALAKITAVARRPAIAASRR